DTVDLASGIDGVIEAVTVSEGDPVTAGQVVARIAAADLAAAARAAAAEVESLRQRKARLVRGSRAAERKGARPRAEAADGAARGRHERATSLAQRGWGSEESEQIARRDEEAALGELDAAVAHETLVDAEPLPEELALADADIAAAESRRDQTAALFEKSLIRSPIAGTVVRRHLEPGESVSTTFPRPIVSVADLSRLRVRA